MRTFYPYPPLEAPDEDLERTGPAHHLSFASLSCIEGLAQRAYTINSTGTERHSLNYLSHVVSPVFRTPGQRDIGTTLLPEQAQPILIYYDQSLSKLFLFPCDGSC